jgi:inner membrane protein
VLAGALATILAADLALARVKMPWLVGGAVDEPAHLATAVLVYANLPAAGPVWTAAFAAGSVAPDVDHVPVIPVRHKLRGDEPRPALHTLATPAVVAVAGAVSRARAREAVLGLAAGICVHFVRDVATGTGIAPLLPLSSRRLKLPVRPYEAAMAVLAWRAWTLPGHR